MQLIKVGLRLWLVRVLVVQDPGEIAANHEQRRQRLARSAQLRHYYASVMLAGGVSIKELAEYLGHSDPAFTLRVYAHMLPCSHDRARAVISERFTRVIGPGR